MSTSRRSTGSSAPTTLRPITPPRRAADDQDGCTALRAGRHPGQLGTSGFIRTPLVEDLGGQSPEGVEAFREYLDSLHPIGHVGEPDDIAHGIVYLASDESKFCTGSELVIDGGSTAQ